MKIYDCFIFYNEFELLELRLKSLWEVVDCFVIVEADRTLANEPKPFYFWERQDEFREFFPKIRHLPVEMNVPFKGVGDWSIEHAQRDAILYGLADAAPDDLVFISDADEFPAPDILQQIYKDKVPAIVDHRLPDYGGRRKSVQCATVKTAAELLEEYPLVMEQNFHYYYFDLIQGKWRGTILTKRKNLTTPQELRDLRNDLPRVGVGGGYHFSYMGGAERVINKMTSIVDGNAAVVYSGGKLLDKNHVEKSLANGTDIYNRAGRAAAKPYDAKNIRLPYLDEFLRKYPYFLREPEKYFGVEKFHG